MPTTGFLSNLFGLIFSSILIAMPLLASAEQPNVILIMTDDQGYGDMSCHGNPELATPCIDDLYRSSVRLTDFHVDPTCSPTRAALMTGKYSTRVGVWLTYMGRHHLRRHETTMAKVFQDNDYRTAIFGKWHLGDNFPFRPNDRGFDESLIHGGGVVGEAPDFWANNYYDDVYLRNGQIQKVDGYCTDVWFDEAIRMIEAKNDQPFFIYLPTNAPHGPFNVPRKYVEPYLDAGIPHSRAQFYGCIAKIDENIGRLRNCLQEQGEIENTILIFMTDNGTAGGCAISKDGKVKSGFNAGMRGKKATAYEGGHRATGLIRWPTGKIGGEEHARDIGKLTAHIDLLPTLIELCDLSPPKIEFDGISIAKLLQNGEFDEQQDRTLFVHHQGRFGQVVTDDRPIKYKNFAVLTEKWRLVGHENSRQLFDIESDPGQIKEVQDANPQIVEKLMEQYEQWWQDVTQEVDGYARTVVGSPKQRVTKITCQQWHAPRAPYNQYHVRNGMPVNGFVDLEVATKGRYTIELRRWPRELDLPFDAVVQPPNLDPNFVDAKNKNASLPGKQFNFVSAKLKIGEQQFERDIQGDERKIIFDVDLEVGPVNLQTWLTDRQQQSIGAYYVYVERQTDANENSIHWKRRTILESAKTSINTVVASDFDNDGNVDIAASYDGGVWVHQGPQWRAVKVHQFKPGLSRRNPRPTCIHSCLIDVDGDGDKDFIGSNQTVFWLECPADPFSGQPWKYRTIDDEILGTHCLLAGDVDGDDKPDLIANSFQDATQTKLPESIVWFSVPDQPTSGDPWPRNVFSSGDAPGGSHYMGLGDLNGDGRVDITCAAKGNPFPNGNWFAWWEQPKNAQVNHAPWQKHVLSENQMGATNIIPANIDGDSDMDIVATRGHGQGVLWFRGPNFERIEIDPMIEGPHTLVVSDLDKDGDNDIAVCGRGDSGVAAWYQNDGFGNFRRFEIDRGQGSYDLRAVDLDQDGDLDLINAGHQSKNLVWYENNLTNRQ